MLLWQHNTLPWTDSLVQLSLEYAPPVSINSYDYLALSGLYDKYFRLAPNLTLLARFTGDKEFTSKIITNILNYGELVPFSGLSLSGEAKVYNKLNVSYPLYRYGEINSLNAFYCPEIIFNCYMENAVLWSPQTAYFAALGLQFDYKVVFTSILPMLTCSLGYAVPVAAPTGIQGISQLYILFSL